MKKSLRSPLDKLGGISFLGEERSTISVGGGEGGLEKEEKEKRTREMKKRWKGKVKEDYKKKKYGKREEGTGILDRRMEENEKKEKKERKRNSW